MRNAVARFNEDLSFDAPPEKTRQRAKPVAPARKKKLARKPAKKTRRPYGRYAAAGLTTALTIGIIVNALSLQNSRHPAPLFGNAIQLGDQPAAKTALLEEPIPTPLPRKDDQPAPVPGSSHLVAPPAPPAPNPGPAAPAPAVKHEPAPPVAVAHPHHAQAEAPAPTHRPKPADPIAALIIPAMNQAAVKPESSKPEASKSEGAKPETLRPAAKVVLAVQHALLKLGYVVSPNGNFGPETRGAIQAFEREQHLPPSGELSRKLLKELSEESGLAIE